MGAVTIPVLPSADFDRTAGFYAALGFAETGRWPAEYLILRHGAEDIELHFWSHPTVDRWTNDVSCYVRFATPDEVVAFHARWADVAVPEPAVLRPPREEPHGAVELHLIDLDGNLVKFGGFPAS